MELKDWLTAGAAILAAVLSLITLIVSGRRQQVTWKREALEGAFVQFLTASYNHKSACKHIVRLADGAISRRTSDEWKIVMRDSYETMLDCMSRIRVLAGDLVTDEKVNPMKRINNQEAELIGGGRYDLFKTGKASRDTAFQQARTEFLATVHSILEVKHMSRVH